MLRGDLPRLSRATSILTESASSPIKRSKPLKYAYEKEIVLYAHHRKLEYFSTECIYSPEAFRGSARALVKNLEKIRPSAILDLVRSGEDMAKCVPQADEDTQGKSCGSARKPRVARTNADAGDETEGGCGSANGRSVGSEMAEMEKQLRENENAGEREVEVTVRNPAPANGQRHNRDRGDLDERRAASPSSRNRPIAHVKGPAKTPKKSAKQHIGQCERCGYLSSQAICKACMLLEGLNRNRPSREIGFEDNSIAVETLAKPMSQVSVADSNG